MAFSFWAGLASGWVGFGLAGFGFFLPSWLLGLIGFGWLWAGLAFYCVGFLLVGFCWVGFGLRIFTKLSLGWVGFGLLDWLWVGWLWLFANSSWHFAGLALG